MAQPSQEAVALKRGDSRLRDEITDPRVLFHHGMWSRFVDSTDQNPTSVWRTLNAECGAQAIPIYDEMEEKVDQYGAMLEQRREAVLSKPWRVNPASESARDQAVADFCTEAIEAIPDWSSKLNEALDGIGKGVAIAELIYALDGRRLTLADVKFRNQGWFCFGEIGQPEIGPLRLGLLAGGASGEILPANKFLVCTFGGRRGNRWGRPLGRRCFWPGWFLRQGIRFWLKWLEKGNGTIVAKYQAGQQAEQQAKALAAAEAAQDTTAIAIPDDFLLEILEDSRTGSSDAYERMVRRCEGAIAKTVLGQTLTSAGADQGAGSRAVADVHDEVRQEKVEADAAWLSRCVTQGILKPLVELNFGLGAPVPEFVVEAEEGEDASAAADLLIKAKTKLGMRIGREYAHDRLQIPLADEGEDALGEGEGEGDETGDKGQGEDGEEFAEEAADPEPEKIAGQGVAAASKVHRDWVEELVAAAMEELPE